MGTGASSIGLRGRAESEGPTSAAPTLAPFHVRAAAQRAASHLWRAHVRPLVASRHHSSARFCCRLCATRCACTDSARRAENCAQSCSTGRQLIGSQRRASQAARRRPTNCGRRPASHRTTANLISYNCNVTDSHPKRKLTVCRRTRTPPAPPAARANIGLGPTPAELAAPPTLSSLTPSRQNTTLADQDAICELV